MNQPSALIAEDEPLLAEALRQELQRAWPELTIAAMVGDGASAVAQALALQPEVLFLDIRMPGMSGLEAAAELLQVWPVTTDSAPFPALVFVTAYDQYAVQAFDAQAVDYLLKPLQADRLERTVKKLRLALELRASQAPQNVASGTPGNAALEATLAQLRGLLGGALASVQAPISTLTHIQASVGNTIRLLPVSEVVYFEAADKYMRVLTAQREYLIRTPLKELVMQLDARTFWQVHRSTVVNSNCIDSVTRDEAGKLWLQLSGRPERLVVSRLFAHLFKAM
jgi:DNA-binding LytR/AlgR family response regulator